jgi:glycosyltransferase involved in cell wall biosynthesis
MIRVAQVIETLGRGGAERLLVDIAHEIDRKRFTMSVYTLFRHPRTYAGALKDLGIAETCLELRGRGDILWGIARLPALLRREGADVVHTHLFSANIIGRLAARAVRLPVVSSLHDADYEPAVLQGNPGLTPWKQGLLQHADRLAAWVSRANLVAVSEYVADSARRRLVLGASRVEVVYNGVDTSIFHPNVKDERRRVREALGLSASTRVVISIGRMIPTKGQGTLLEAVRLLLDRAIDVHVLLAGEGQWRSRYEALARDLGLQGRAIFLGDRADIPVLIGAADVLALPSLHEGFGLALIEALACGVPVVASRTGPMPELVRDGETGLLIDAGSATELAASLAVILLDDDRRRRMGAVGREDAVARFSLPRMVRQLEAVYERVARRQRLAG